MTAETESLPDDIASEDSVADRRGVLRDVAVGALFAFLAFVVMAGQWESPSGKYLRLSGQDQTMWEWFFAVAARSLTHLQNPLFSDLQNSPLGVNMMANTAMFGLSLPLAPVTLAFGPSVTFVLALTLGLATTAFGWYWLLSRTVVGRPAAAVGGLMCGFAPGMISHANAHPNFTVLGVLPFIALAAIRLGQGVNVRRNTVVLGLLGAWQVFLGEEPLLIFAIAFAVFAVAWFLGRPTQILPILRRGTVPALVSAALASVLIAVPLWWQFRGPQSYEFLEHRLPANDLDEFWHFPPQSLWAALSNNISDDLAVNTTEQNAYFGAPLLIVVAIAALWMWRSVPARAAAVTAVVLGVMSMGAELTIGGDATGIMLPGSHIDEQPLLRSVLETRFVLAVMPAFAVIVALALDRALKRRRAAPVAIAALAVALVPLAPVPLPTSPTPSTPAFFADGTWRQYVAAGSVVTVPTPTNTYADPLLWQIDAGLGFRLAGGYFVGPRDDPERAGEGRYGPNDRSTASLLGQIRREGTVPAVTAEQRAAAVTDLKFWNADIMVLPPMPNSAALRSAVDQLTGMTGRFVDGVWLWDVRSIVNS